MIKSIITFSAVLAVSSSLAGVSLAQDAGLYANAIDPNKAYVRVLVQDSGQASIAGNTVSLTESLVSGYVSVPAGAVAIGAGDGSMEMNVEPGTYYTFAQAQDGFVEFVDPPISDPSKAEVLFYNLTDKSGVNLFVPAAKTNAMSDVAAQTSQSVELRAPLALSFEAQLEGKTLAAANDVSLERKQAVSLFLTQTSEGLDLVQVINSFAEAR
jgi:hypothetical protein